MKGYRNIFLYLDHDNSGKKTQEKYQAAGLNTVDASLIYKQHKDVNDYLMAQESSQKEMEKAADFQKVWRTAFVKVFREHVCVLASQKPVPLSRDRKLAFRTKLMKKIA